MEDSSRREETFYHSELILAANYVTFVCKVSCAQLNVDVPVIELTF